MKRSEICLCHRWCLPILIQLRDSFLRHRLHDHVGGGRYRCNIALRASRRLETGGSSVTNDGGRLVSFTSHDGMGAGTVQRVVNEKQKA
jgi:hypothetical protein